MHTLVDMLHLTWKEFERNLKDLKDEDARKHIEPMNCISWIVAHVANQHHTFFVAWVNGTDIESRYLPYGYGSPASQPPLTEAMALWRDACKDADKWLGTVTAESLGEKPATHSPESENMGTLMVRCIFHTWYHLGEINSIRQVLGHRPPEFVNMHDWLYTAD